MNANEPVVLMNVNLLFVLLLQTFSLKLEIWWAMLTKWYPSLPHVLYGKVLVLLWETSFIKKLKIEGAVWHHVVNNHESFMKFCAAVLEE